MPTLPPKPTLAEFQAFIRDLVAEKAWTTDPDEIFALFVEEVGEVAKELRRSWTRGRPAVAEAAGEELADTFMYLLDLANAFGVDLEASVRRKIEKNAARTEFGH